MLCFCVSVCVHVYVHAQQCVRSMASLETIGPLMSGMKMRADMAGLACEALNRMFQREQTDLVSQVAHLSIICRVPNDTILYAVHYFWPGPIVL